MRRSPPSPTADVDAAAIRLRKSLPLAAAIRWTPVAERGEPAWDSYDVFITQDALRAVDRHVWSAPDQELLGFLLGDLYECQETGEVYLIVHAVLRTEHVIEEEAPEQIPDAVWRETQQVVRTRRARIVGWYHSAPYVGQAPSASDVITHRARFPEPWQVGLVVATSGPPAGAVFRVVEGTTGPAGGAAANAPSAPGGSAAAGLPGLVPPRGVFTPFLELLHKDALPEADGRKASVIDWRNYEPAERVTVVETVPKERGAASAAAAGARGGGRATPGSSGVLIPTGADHPTIPPPPVVRRRVLPTVLYALVAIGVVVGAVVLARRVIPSLNGGAQTDGRPAATAPAAPGGDVAGAAGGAGGARGAATRPQGGGGSAALPVDASAAAVRRFAAAADSLSRAVTNYGMRAEDFRLHRIGCAQLATGYRLADEQFQTMASVYREVRDSLVAPQHARFQRLTDSVATLNQQFDASDCPRP